MKSSRCQAAHSLIHSLTHSLTRSLTWPSYMTFLHHFLMRMFSITLCSYQDILHIPTSFQQFSTSLGPIVDGHVIPNQPYKVMGHYTEHFSRFVKQLLSQFSHPSILALDPAGPCPRRPAEYTHYWPDYLFIVRYLIRCLAFGIRLPLVKSNRP